MSDPDQSAHSQDTAKAEDGNFYVVFKVAGGLLALDVAHVLSVESIPPITPVPDAPPHIPGVVNLHGDITVLVDLTVLRGQEVPANYRPNCIVMALLGEHPCGLLASQTGEVEKVDNIGPPLPDPSGLRLIRGLAEVDSQLVGILDSGRLADLLTNGVRSVMEAAGP